MVVFGFTCKSSGYGEGVAVHVGIGEEILQQVAGAAGTSCTVHADCPLMHDPRCRLDVEHRHVAEGIRGLRHKDLPLRIGVHKVRSRCAVEEDVQLADVAGDHPRFHRRLGVGTCVYLHRCCPACALIAGTGEQ